MSSPGPWTITYHYIANADPATGTSTGLEPGWISVRIDSSGAVTGSYAPAPIPSVRKRREFYAMDLPQEHAEELYALLSTPGFETHPGRTLFDLNEGEPVILERSSGDGPRLNRAYATRELPGDLRPLLARLTALVRELQAHVVPHDPS